MPHRYLVCWLHWHPWPNFGAPYRRCTYTYCGEAMKSVGCNCNLRPLPYMMKVMVVDFVSKCHKVTNPLFSSLCWFSSLFTDPRYLITSVRGGMATTLYVVWVGIIGTVLLLLQFFAGFFRIIICLDLYLLPLVTWHLSQTCMYLTPQYSRFITLNPLMDQFDAWPRVRVYRSIFRSRLGDADKQSQGYNRTLYLYW